jgi:hypothetical protein
MCVVAVLVDEQGSEVGALLDPNGGRFDPAGDFDRLVGNATDGSLGVWRAIDPYAIVTLNSAEMPGLLADLAELEPLAKVGPERRGLSRLRVMGAECRDNAGFAIRFVGDLFHAHLSGLAWSEAGCRRTMSGGGRHFCPRCRVRAPPVR